MRRTIKYIISFIFILIVTCSGLLCSASIFSEFLTSEQLNYIVSAASYSGLKGSWTNYTFSNETGTYYSYGSVEGNTVPLSSANPVLNYPLFLSNFDTLVIQFSIFREFSGTQSISSVQSVSGSIASNLSFEQIGTIASGPIPIPGGTNTTGYRGVQYQITVTEPIDYLRITLNIPSYSVYNDKYLFSLMGIQVIGTSEALQNIDYQVSQIGTKVDTLTSAIQNASSNIGVIVDGQGDILTSTQDIKDFVASIDSKQDIIIYATQNDQLIIQEYNERLTEIKNEFNEYNSILEQYYNAPDVNNVTNIIDGGMPSEYDPTVVAPVLSAIFDNSIVTIILVAVLALAVMSYVLFGKKG